MSAMSEFCTCTRWCGDDGDIDGEGTCTGLPREPLPPPVEIVLVRRDDIAATNHGEPRGA